MTAFDIEARLYQRRFDRIPVEPDALEGGRETRHAGEPAFDLAAIRRLKCETLDIDHHVRERDCIEQRHDPQGEESAIEILGVVLEDRVHAALVARAQRRRLERGESQRPLRVQGCDLRIRTVHREYHEGHRQKYSE